MSLTLSAHVSIARPALWITEISARLRSFGAEITTEGATQSFVYAFGQARITMGADHYVLTAQSDSENGLARLQELLAVAVELHARPDAPVVRWQGDLTEAERPRHPPQFREMRVVSSERLTPNMQRVTLAGENLYRFEEFEGLHVRMLFPREGTRWPGLGSNGLPVWPDEPERPDVRVYTIRYIDAATGRMVIDFVLHGATGVGGPWAERAQAGDIVGVLGPVGRPIRPSDWLMMGADATGLPALSRLVERLPANTGGQAIIEVSDPAEEIPFTAPEGFQTHWLHRGTGPSRLVETLLARDDWAARDDSFGWFAAEHGQAHTIRQHWRGTLGLTRDRTLVAGYWRLGEKGAMAKI